MPVTSRPYANPADLRSLQALAQETTALRGPHAHRHVGGLAWDRLQHVGREPEWPTRIWEEEEGRVVAWGWLRLPGELELVVHPGRPQLVETVLDWFERSAAGAEQSVWAVADDRGVTEPLEARGYRPAEREPWMALLTRGLDRLPGAVLPRGYTARSVAGDVDVERRVAVHRAAFHPSRVTVESYRAVMQAWPYRPELDCVVEAPDGSFAAFTLAWLDEANRVGELEPVGTHPAHRRLGLARAANLLALHRLGEAGATSAVVACRGDDAYPAPKRLYESVGFRQVARVLSYRRPRRT